MEQEKQKNKKALLAELTLTVRELINRY